MCVQMPTKGRLLGAAFRAGQRHATLSTSYAEGAVHFRTRLGQRRRGRSGDLRKPAAAGLGTGHHGRAPFIFWQQGRLVVGVTHLQYANLLHR